MLNFMFSRNKTRVLTILLLIPLCLQTACGTLLHPERRGQTSGRIDPSIAILNGIGLLLFVIPGLVAFAVDFSTGAIYLPPDEAAGPDADEQVVYMDPDEITPETLSAVIYEHTGNEVTLTEEDMHVLEKSDPEEVRAELAAMSRRAN